jgi:hypothetical protein
VQFGLSDALGVPLVSGVAVVPVSVLVEVLELEVEPASARRIVPLVELSSVSAVCVLAQPVRPRPIATASAIQCRCFMTTTSSKMGKSRWKSQSPFPRLPTLKFYDA